MVGVVPDFKKTTGCPFVSDIREEDPKQEKKRH